jgi:hypothetical protein
MGWECIMEELGRCGTMERATEGDTMGNDRGRCAEVMIGMIEVGLD